jgi:hypothetical protein
VSICKKDTGLRDRRERWILFVCIPTEHNMSTSFLNIQVVQLMSMSTHERCVRVWFMIEVRPCKIVEAGAKVRRNVVNDAKFTDVSGLQYIVSHAILLFM